MIEVWFIVDNHTAHNILLQILVGTGIIGMVLFLLALGALARAFLSLRHGDRSAREVFAMLVITAVWYLGWSTLCESFMGPVRSESVFFYTFVGLGLGQLSRIEAYPRAAGVGFSAN
jgi:O-antigen ligase